MNASTSWRPIENVLIDFLNREDRILYGLFANLKAEAHVRLLTNLLNVAVFFCHEYCITSPGPIAECTIAQEALRRRADYLRERVIRLPIRENDIGSFLEKKERQYGGHPDIYRNLFSATSDRFLHRFTMATTGRQTHIGQFIAKQWEAGPDTDPNWSGVLQDTSAKEVEDIRLIGQRLASDGSAVNWPNIRDILTNQWTLKEPELHRILQHYYFNAYLAEYRLQQMTGLPFGRSRTFGGSALSYDYEALKEALLACVSWKAVLTMSASSLLKLRSRLGYFRMRNLFDGIATVCKSPREVGRQFAFAVSLCRPAIRKSKVIDELARKGRFLAEGVEWSDSGLNALDDRWLAVCDILEATRVSSSEEAIAGSALAHSLPVSQPEIALLATLTRAKSVIIIDQSMRNNVQVKGNANINIDSVLSEVAQTIAGASPLDPQEKDYLSQLTQKLEEEIKAIKTSHPSESELVANNLRTLVDAAASGKEQANKRVIELSSKGLIEAAATVATIAPGVLATAQLVANFFMK